MSIPVHLTLLVIVLLAGVAGGLFFMRILAPAEAGPVALSGLYALIFLASFGLTSLLGFGLRLVFRLRPNRRLSLNSSVRQGTLLGILVVGLLILSANQLLNFWTGALLLLVLGLLEFYLQQR